MAHRDDFDDEFLDDDAEALDYKPISSEESSGAKGIKLFIAATVIAAIGGAGWYFVGNSHSSLDNVPLVRADTQPTKEKPSDPGGMNVPNRDKTVYKRLSGQSDEPKLERLLPRSEEPLEKPVVGMDLPELSKTTSPVTGNPAISKELPASPVEETQPAASKTQATQVAQSPEPVEVPTEEMAAAIQAPPPAPVVDPNAPRALTKRAPVQKQDQDQLSAKIAEVMNEPEAPAKPAPVVETKKVTPPPPAPVAMKKPTVQVAKVPTKPTPVKTTPAPKGSYLLQLLSSKSESGVQKSWKKIQTQNNDILSKMSSNIVKADLGDKGIYYRLRLGPIATADKAKALCSQLKLRKVGCFIVRVR